MQEFIEALVATLFPPPNPLVSRVVCKGDMEVWGRERADDVMDDDVRVSQKECV